MSQEVLLEAPQASDSSWALQATKQTTPGGPYVPINLTGATITMRIETPTPIVLNVGSGIVVTNAAQGLFTVSVNDAHTNVLPRAYEYTIRVLELDDTDTLVLYGNLMIEGSETNPGPGGSFVEFVSAEVPYLDIRSFGTVHNGTTNDTAAVQAAFDAAAAQGLKAVWVAPVNGAYRLEAPVTVPRYVTVFGGPRGMGRGLRVTDPTASKGSLFNVMHTGVAFNLEAETTVDGIEVWYPNQVQTGTPILHDFTFKADIKHAITLRNIRAPNPYRFIYLKVDGACLENLYAFPLETGIHLGRCAHVIHADRVDLQPNALPGANQSLRDWVQANATAIKIDGAEMFQFDQIFAFGYQRGIWFVDGTLIPGSTGQVNNFGFDQCKTGILITNKGVVNDGVTFSDGSIVPLDEAIKFDDSTAAAPDKPCVYFSNVRVFNGLGYERAVWYTAGSRGQLTWHGGYAHNYTDEMFLLQSATAMLRTSHVENRQGGTRVNNPGGGTVSELGAF